MGTSQSDYVLIYKDDAFWIAVKVLGYPECYRIFEGIEYNGFETPADAYSFLYAYLESSK